MSRLPVCIGLPQSLGVGLRACSICRCGDPTFNALGRAGLSPLVEDLNGVQDERAVFNVGMSYLWGKS